MTKNVKIWRILAYFAPVTFLVVLGLVLNSFSFTIIPPVQTAILDSDLTSSSSSLFVAPEAVVPRRKKSPLIVVKGIYLTASTTNNSKTMEHIIGLMDKTELNAVVIDIKDYTGYVLYDSQINDVVKLKTKKVVLKDIPALITKLHSHDIYVIARQTVFQDPILAKKKIEWAIKDKRGGVWHDHKGLAWVDSAKEEVWKYNLAIAKEAIELGFDEINFDYVRFPTDGKMADAVIPPLKQRNAAMTKFFSFISEHLQAEPAYISLDFFGLVMENHTGMSIGQQIASAADKVDYISPMMYPSHYAKGHLGLVNPAAYPGKVINNGMKLGGPLFDNHRAKVRPWLQAFSIGAVYGAKNIRAQIDAVEKYPNAGWLLWNASNRYTSAGLKPGL